LGNNGAAAQHFESVAKMISVSEKSSLLGRYVERHPEFPGIVHYNRASALSKTDNWDDYKMALSLMTSLLSHLDGCPSADGQAPSTTDTGDANYKRLLKEAADVAGNEPCTPEVATTIGCPKQRMRLEVLALSALASALVFELESPSEYPLTQPLRL